MFFCHEGCTGGQSGGSDSEDGCDVAISENTDDMNAAGEGDGMRGYSYSSGARVVVAVACRVEVAAVLLRRVQA